MLITHVRHTEISRILQRDAQNHWPPTLADTWAQREQTIHVEDYDVVRGVGGRVVRLCLTREREKERESKRNEERILFIF